ncbi:MAG TPA: choice-of-anchor J domain-containing protein [Edaphocola sp.]|nr:choice-of-anchor J domain-containing protein [Edaphocola sp.]
MKANFTKACAGIIGTVCLASLGIQANAQITYPYVADFETSTTTPASKSYAATTVINMNGMDWVMPGVYLGSMSAADRYNGDRAARIRLSDNSTGTPGYLEMQANLTSGAGVVSYKAANYGSEGPDSIVVSYSVDNGSSWTIVGTDPVTDTVLTAFAHNVNIAGNIRFKFQKKNTGNGRINLDDIQITAFGAPSFTIVGKTPEGNNVPLATDSITITFNDDIVASTGSLYLYKVGTAAPVATFAASSATISGNKAIFSPIALENNTSYYVTVDSSLFTDGLAGANSPVNASEWTFTTEDTLPPAPMTSLVETFADCQAELGMGAFKQYSEVGNKTWACSRFGRNSGGADTAGVYINGGSATNVSEVNKDWLITKAPLDLSAMNMPLLHFYQKKRFSGNVTRDLLISTDYVSGQDPTTATWVSLNVQDLAQDPAGDNVWSSINNINLTPYKNTPFYLAFTYECGDDGAYELTYDDIIIENFTSIKPVHAATIGVNVIGEPSHNNIDLNIFMNAAESVTVQVFDMMGRQIASQNAHLAAGANQVSINGVGFNSGVYVIRVVAGNGFGTAKAVVK